MADPMKQDSYAESFADKNRKAYRYQYFIIGAEHASDVPSTTISALDWPL